MEKINNVSIISEEDPGGYQFSLLTDSASICNIANYNQPYSYHIAIQSGK